MVTSLEEKDRAASDVDQKAQTVSFLLGFVSSEFKILCHRYSKKVSKYRIFENRFQKFCTIFAVTTTPTILGSTHSQRDVRGRTLETLSQTFTTGTSTCARTKKDLTNYYHTLRGYTAQVLKVGSIKCSYSTRALQKRFIFLVWNKTWYLLHIAKLSRAREPKPILSRSLKSQSKIEMGNVQ